MSPNDLSESDSDRMSGSDPAPPSGSDPTYLRTYIRTDGADQDVAESGSFAEHAKDGGPIHIGEIMQDDLLAPRARRHQVIRTGEREPIPSHVRAAVWYRDKGLCAECIPDYPSGDPLHLDHIYPWSAGGPDTTDNLRLLCERHNLDRSNFVDYARPKRPVTWWCSNCYVLDEHIWTYKSWMVDCPWHRTSLSPDPEKSRCRVARAFGRAWLAGEPLPTWHQERPLLTEWTRVAYCAHCNRPGLTDVPL